MEPIHLNSAVIFHLLLFLALTLFFELFSVACNARQCLQVDSSALLQLKRGFTSDELHTWRPGTNCCIWEGVTCDDELGRVIGLDLSDQSITGKIDFSLFNLTSLRTLNLANNLFGQIPIPDFGWDKLANLTTLDLFHAGFVGNVPAGISRLSKLTSLDLSENYLEISLTNNPTFLRNMSNLKELSLNLVNLSAVYMDEWCSALVNSTPVLEVLSMDACSLSGGGCSSLSMLPLLSVVSLGSNKLDSSIFDSFVNLTSLTELRVQENGFTGFFPKQIFLLRNLKYLNISYNPMLSGSLPHFSKGNTLEILVLSGTNFSGKLPHTISNLKFLRDLDLSNCQFFGRVPSTMGNLSQLKLLDLSSNKLQGLVPRSLFQIPRLVLLSLASNSFNGAVELEFIKDLKTLTYLDLSNSGFSLSSWDTDNGSLSSFFPKISTLNLVGCNLTKFPAFIKYQHKLVTLDLSNNRIRGEIPSYLRSISERNRSTSLIPANISLYPYLTFFYLANNSITGEVPPSICSLTQLLELDLSSNKLTGSIPPCLLEEGINLQVLDLRRNHFHGSIPHRISHKCNLRVLNLRYNHLEGQLPKSLSNCQSLGIIDIGDNNLNDTFPHWLGNIFSLRVLVLRSNKFYGPVASPNGNHEINYTISMLHVFDISSNNFSGNLCTKFFSNFKSMMITRGSTTSAFACNISSHFDVDVPTIMKKGKLLMLQKFYRMLMSIDFSNNYFEGEIPTVIGQLISLQVLNMSQNLLTGKIPPQLGNLSQLESLDLSMNSLSGNIPFELVSLYFLSYLNLSYNKLVGKIPLGGQFSTFPNTSFEGNQGLCCWLSYNSSVSRVNKTSTSPPSFDKMAPKNRSYMIVLGILFGVGFGGCMAVIILFDVICCDRRNRRGTRRFRG